MTKIVDTCLLTQKYNTFLLVLQFEQSTKYYSLRLKLFVVFFGQGCTSINNSNLAFSSCNQENTIISCLTVCVFWSMQSLRQKDWAASLFWHGWSCLENVHHEGQSCQCIRKLTFFSAVEENLFSCPVKFLVEKVFTTYMAIQVCQ